MSELSPMRAARLGELALEPGIPNGVLNVVHGYGREAGKRICRHPDVRAISFTGAGVLNHPTRASRGARTGSRDMTSS